LKKTEPSISGSDLAYNPSDLHHKYPPKEPQQSSIMNFYKAKKSSGSSNLNTSNTEGSSPPKVDEEDHFVRN